jgi:NAD(P) transhydrogenase subunit alpha
VALVPSAVPALTKKGLEVMIESGAGVDAGHADEEYAEKGARIAFTRAEVFAQCDILLQVHAYGAIPSCARADLEMLRPGQVVIGFFDPLSEPAEAAEVARRGVTAFAMELMPRITRAQNMDALSSMATIAGYKAVLLAADRLPRMFPLLMTAAGTVTPAHVFVIGAGVAGLQAIATARRLGAVVQAYDVRPAVREQVESLGARFVELPLQAADAEDRGGYARAQDEEFYRRQRELMAREVAASDVVITTAAVPGRKAPVLVTRDMVAGMRLGSVIVDLASERGGNCELTRAGETVVESGVTILGPVNLPGAVPYHASQLYARNISAFLLYLVKDGAIPLDSDDPIVKETLITRGGEVVHPRLRAALGLAELVASQ